MNYLKVLSELSSFIKSTVLFQVLLLISICLQGCMRVNEIVEESPSINNPYNKCKIVKETYKTLNNISKVGQETVRVNNNYYPVSLESTKFYSYDASGRLISERSIGGWDYDSVATEYSYKNREIVIKQSLYKNYFPKIQIDTLALNSTGLVDRFGNLKYVYTDDGYLLKRYNSNNVNYKNEYTINDKNISKESFFLGSWTDNSLNEFDVKQYNTPFNKPFYGKQSRNLLVKTTGNVTNSVVVPNGDKYVYTYHYFFDEKNRVVRRIRLNIPLDKSWAYLADTGGVGFIDYEYECL